MSPAEYAPLVGVCERSLRVARHDERLLLWVRLVIASLLKSKIIEENSSTQCSTTMKNEAHDLLETEGSALLV